MFLKKLLLLTLAICLSFNVFCQWNLPGQHAQVVVPTLPDDITFCGEEMPIQKFDVKESLQREMNSLAYWHSSIIYTLQLANRHFPTIERILKEQGVPDDLKYLCVAESNLQNLISPARAVGYWQILEGTAKDYGLEVGAEIDERYNLEKSTVAACKYLKDAYNKFGSWSTAAASYNVGMGHITRQLSVQKVDSYYDLDLNMETARYVYRATAFKIIMQSPSKYGFMLSPKELFSELKYKEVKAKAPVDWVDFAKGHGTTLKVLKIYNPWIRSIKLTKGVKEYKIRIPKY